MAESCKLCKDVGKGTHRWHFLMKIALRSIMQTMCSTGGYTEVLFRGITMHLAVKSAFCASFLPELTRGKNQPCFKPKQKSSKFSTWMQSQKQQKDLCSFPRKTI